MKKQEMMLNGSTLKIETGQVARQSSGSVIVSHGETTILVAVNAAPKAREDIDFFPLQVEYRERHYAGGKIPGGFFKREARPTEHEILTSRLTDRPIRPLFPKSFKNETQIIITVMSSDGENMADTLAGLGASAALMISDLPFKGPIATVRVGRVNGEFVVNPTRTQMEESDMEIIVSGNEKTIVMVEGEAKLITEEEFLDAMKFAHGPIKELIDLQNKLIAEIEVIKRDVIDEDTNEELEKAVSDLVTSKIETAIKTSDKSKREKLISELKDEALSAFVESYPDSEKMVSNYLNSQLKSAFREQILTEGKRSDGRKTTDIRPITVETGILPRTHGSALFTRGETQAIVVLTMGTPRDEQIIDSMDIDAKKEFLSTLQFPSILRW
jgi:polyribonucleotide nucleotidyltransferase